MTDELEKRVNQLEQDFEQLAENQKEIVENLSELSTAVTDITDSMIASKYMDLMADDKLDEFKENNPEEAEQAEEILNKFLTEET